MSNVILGICLIWVEYLCFYLYLEIRKLKKKYRDLVKDIESYREK